MHFIDTIIFIIYFALMLGVGYYFFRKNQSVDDYYVGGRSIGSWQIDGSVVATDVGGGFSMGLSVSWLLFTGLIGEFEIKTE